MAKDNLRLISARIDEKSYQKLEALANRYTYWKKNYILRKILLAVLNDFNEEDIFDMLRRPYNPKLPVRCEYLYPYVEDDSKQ